VVCHRRGIELFDVQRQAWVHSFEAPDVATPDKPITGTIYQGHSATFSPDGEWIATGHGYSYESDREFAGYETADQVIRVWRASDLALEATHEQGDYGDYFLYCVQYVAFGQRGEVFGQTPDGPIKAHHGAKVRSFHFFHWHARLRMTDDDEVLAFHGQSLTWLDAETGAVLATSHASDPPAGRDGRVPGVTRDRRAYDDRFQCLSADWRVFAVCPREGPVEVIDSFTRQRVQTFPRGIRRGPVYLSGDGSVIGIGHKTVDLFRVADRSPLRGSVAADRFTLSHSGDWFARVSDGSLGVGSTRTEEQDRVVATGARPTLIAISPDGRRLATAGGPGADDVVQLWEVESGGAAPLVQERALGETVRRLCFSAQGRLLALADRDKCRLAGADKPDPKLPPYSWCSVDLGPPFRVPQGPKRLYSLKASPAAPLVAVGDGCGHVVLWHQDGHVVGFLDTGSRDRVTSVGFSHDGQLLAAGDDSGAAFLFAVGGLSLLRTSAGKGAAIEAAVPRGDGTVVLCDARGRIWVWGEEGRRLVKRAGGKQHHVAAASALGKHVALASGVVRVIGVP
jgi:WD40 repeat protein